jgi:two-component system chemotaxis response regulator CheY
VEQKRQAAAPKTVGAASVLVVEDQTFIQELMSRMLKRIGVRKILTARSGEDALYNLTEDPNLADVVLLDFELLGMNGYRFLEKLRGHENAHLKQLPVVVVTAHNDMQLYGRMAGLGIAGFLVKPVGSEPLQQALTAALAGHRATPSRRAPEVGDSWQARPQAQADDALPAVGSAEAEAPAEAVPEPAPKKPRNPLPPKGDPDVDFSV